MEIDDPAKPEFASMESYQTFSRNVSKNSRFIHNKETQAFLDTVSATVDERAFRHEEGKCFFRAQVGVNYEPDPRYEGEEMPVGFGKERMIPRHDRAREGRVNVAGVPVLYLANNIITAISETRPWIGSAMSVAVFKTVRSLNLVHLTIGDGLPGIFHLPLCRWDDGISHTADEKKEAIWRDIDNAFSCPVTRSDDTACYVPTQILSELFKSKGFDGIVYKSRFGENGRNLALFDCSSAVPVSCTPYIVNRVNIEVTESNDTWVYRDESNIIGADGGT